MKAATWLARPARQRGAATLVVVMVLFFLMLLVSAYAGRTLIFEQRTSANQYRSAQAYEAATGGLEWALAMLNSDRRIDASCQPSTDANHNTFRDRYLAMDINTDKVTPATPPSGRFAACMRGANGWQCQCPTGTSPSLVADATTGAAFVMEMLPVPAFTPAQPLRLTVWACSSATDSRCYGSGTNSSDGYATQSMQVALVSALQQPPTAALTSWDEVNIPAGMIVVNQSPGGNAVAVRSGHGVVLVNSASVALPGGVPVDDGLVRDDPQIRDMTLRFFQRHSGLSQTAYRNLPNTTSCQGNSCTDALLNAAANGRRLLHAAGNLTLPANTTLGSPEQPVLLVVDGTLTLQGMTSITGVVYAQQLEWVNGASAASVRGATLVHSACCAGVSGSPSLVYDHEVVKRLQLGAGAYARVPGSWQDK